MASVKRASVLKNIEVIETGLSRDNQPIELVQFLGGCGIRLAEAPEMLICLILPTGSKWDFTPEEKIKFTWNNLLKQENK